MPLTDKKNEGDIIKQETETTMQDDVRNNMQCKYCTSEIPFSAKICPICKSNQKWYLNYVRIGDILLLVSILISFGMVYLSYLNFRESREERIEASQAMEIASKAAGKVEDATKEAKQKLLSLSLRLDSLSAVISIMEKQTEKELQTLKNKPNFNQNMAENLTGIPAPIWKDYDKANEL